MPDLHNLRRGREVGKVCFAFVFFLFLTWSRNIPPPALTCIPCVHKELSHFESVRLHQAFTKCLYSAGLSNLWLTHHDLERAISYMNAIFSHTHFMLSNLFRGERNTCKHKKYIRIGKMQHKCTGWIQKCLIYILPFLFFCISGKWLSHQGVCWAVSLAGRAPRCLMELWYWHSESSDQSLRSLGTHQLLCPHSAETSWLWCRPLDIIKSV